MINVIGLGYIGLPTALALAASGHEVVGTDYNQKPCSPIKISDKNNPKPTKKKLTAR